MLFLFSEKEQKVYFLPNVRTTFVLGVHAARHPHTQNDKKVFFLTFSRLQCFLFMSMSPSILDLGTSRPEHIGSSMFKKLCF